MTVGQRWRFRRNLAIATLHAHGGWSQRMIADVFDLPRSRIQSIIREMEALAAKGGSRPGRSGVAIRMPVPKRGAGKRLPGYSPD